MSSPRRRVKHAIPTAKEPVSMQSVALRLPKKWLIGSITLSFVLALLLLWKFAPANSAPKPSDTPVASVAETSFVGKVTNNFPLAFSPLTPADASDHGTLGNPTLTSVPAHQGEAGVSWRRVMDKKIESGMVTLTLKDERTGELSLMSQPLGTNIDVQEGEGKAFVLTSIPVSAKAELPTQGIETIKAGMTVPSRDPITGKTEFKKVVRTFKHTVYEIVKLELADGKTGKEVDTLKGTPTHPFFTPSGIVAMGDLKPEMKVITRRGPPLVVKSVTPEPHPEGMAVYNFKVEGDHTYFVGKAEGGTWVHNTCNFSMKSLQHCFDRGHAADFGITGNWNKANGAAFQQALENHVANAPMVIQGTYRGTIQATHYFDPATNLWVGVDSGGNFLAGWRLSPNQVKNLLHLGGNIQ